MKIKYRRGDIWEGKLPYKTKGRQQAGDRPLLILQPKEGSNSDHIVVAPISASLRKINFPFIQSTGALERPSQIHYEQIRTIDVEYLVRRLGRLDFKEYMGIDVHLPVSVGLNRTNLMHINDVQVNSVQTHIDPNNNLYRCTIIRIFSRDELYFTRKQLIDQFGPEIIPVLSNGLPALSAFLKTLEGMKFLCVLELEAEYNEP